MIGTEARNFVECFYPSRKAVFKNHYTGLALIYAYNKVPHESRYSFDQSPSLIMGYAYVPSKGKDKFRVVLGNKDTLEFSSLQGFISSAWEADMNRRRIW